MKRLSILISLLVVLGVTMMLLIAYQPPPPDHPMMRSASLYSPGDCLRTPIVQPVSLERWEAPPNFKTLYMIAEVGQQKYRLREWGTQRSSTPQWYPGYAEAVPFAILDNTHDWQLVPCPEQVASAEQLEAELTPITLSDVTYTSSNGGTVYYYNGSVSGR